MNLFANLSNKLKSSSLSSFLSCKEEKTVKL